MGDQLYALSGEVKMPVEPAGTLLSQGWLPGIWVKYSALPVTFSGAISTVELSDGTGILAGFLATGPQHNRPVELLSDMWTTDERQRDGGDTKADWSAFDAGNAFEVDANLQLQRMGSRIVTMLVPNEGIFKVYVFETDDLAERTNPGTGAALTYSPGDPLYVSNRGRFTSEQEAVNHPWTGYVVAKYSSDVEGDYIIIAEAQGTP